MARQSASGSPTRRSNSGAWPSNGVGEPGSGSAGLALGGDALMRFPGTVAGAPTIREGRGEGKTGRLALVSAAERPVPVSTSAGGIPNASLRWNGRQNRPAERGDLRTLVSASETTRRPRDLRKGFVSGLGRLYGTSETRPAAGIPEALEDSFRDASGTTIRYHRDTGP